MSSELSWDIPAATTGGIEDLGVPAWVFSLLWVGDAFASDDAVDVGAAIAPLHTDTDGWEDPGAAEPSNGCGRGSEFRRHVGGFEKLRV